MSTGLSNHHQSLEDSRMSCSWIPIFSRKVKVWTFIPSFSWVRYDSSQAPGLFCSLGREGSKIVCRDISEHRYHEKEIKRYDKIRNNGDTIEISMAFLSKRSCGKFIDLKKHLIVFVVVFGRSWAWAAFEAAVHQSVPVLDQVRESDDLAAASSSGC